MLWRICLQLYMTGISKHQDAASLGQGRELWEFEEQLTCHLCRGIKSCPEIAAQHLAQHTAEVVTANN